MTLEQTIGRCKYEIRYRADYMCLDYDEADIESLTLPDGHTVVALTKIYLPQLVDTAFDQHDPAEYVEVVRTKVSNMWMEYPTHQQVMERYNERASTIKLYAHIPCVHVRFPQLVYMILPDGTIKKSDNPEMIEAMIRRETQREMSEYADRLTKRVKKSLAEQRG